MKPSLMIVSMLLATTAASVTPLLPTSAKAAFTAGSAAATGVDSTQSMALGWPSSSKPLLLLPTGQDNRFFGYLPIRNNTQCKQQIMITTYVQAALGHELVTNPSSARSLTLAPFTSTIYRLELALPDASAVPATGFLEATPKAISSSVDDKDPCKTSPNKLPIPIEIRVRERGLMGWILRVSFFVALGITSIAGILLLHSKVDLFRVMGIANWSFDKSWGANVTLGSALLVSLLGLSVFPDRPNLMSKQSYSLLQIIFGGLVSVAPLVYNLLRQESEVKSNGATRIDSHGYVIMFLLSGGLVLWAAVGQVLTLGVLTQEFHRSGLLDNFTTRALQGISLLLVVLLIIYGLRSLYVTAAHVSQPASSAGKMPGPQPAAPAVVTAIPMTEWSIL